MQKRQYGFIDTTRLVLFQLIKDFTSNLDNNLVATGVVIDWKKSFDTIDHSIFIKKLCYYRVYGIDSSWIQCYSMLVKV